LRHREELGGDGPLLSLSATFGVRERVEGEGRAASEDTSGYRVVFPGDVVINRLVARDGAISISNLHGQISPAYWVLVPEPGSDARFINYLLNSSPYLAEIGARSKCMPPAQFDLPWEQFRTLPIACPDATLQRAIADYLDAETTRIGALIAKKQRMIDVVREQFISMIEHTIPYGRHREARLRWCTRRIADGTHGTYQRQTGGFPLLSAKNLRDGRVVIGADESYVSESDYREVSATCGFQPGDVLYGVIGGSIGNVARLEVGDPTAFQRSVAAVSPSKLLLADYLYLISMGRSFQDKLKLAANSSAQSGVYLGALGDISIPLPSITEQEQIVARLTRVLGSQSALTKSLICQIELLRERQQALITAAVTGEFEVPRVAA